MLTSYISPKEGITAGFWGAIIALVVAFVLAFILTYLFGFSKGKDKRKLNMKSRSCCKKIANLKKLIDKVEKNIFSPFYGEVIPSN